MKRGFTLIELMVTVAIIAILTTIVLAQFGVARSRSRDSKRVADIAQIQLAIQLYFDRCNQFPTASGTGADSIVNIASNVGCPTGLSMATFLNQLPTPPSGNFGTGYGNYRYHVHTTSGVNDNYYLMTKLENNSSSIFDNSITGSIPTPSSGWSGSLTTMTVGASTLYYTVGPK